MVDYAGDELKVLCLLDVLGFESESGTYLGQPIIEAARTERLQKWIGISFGNSFFKPDFDFSERNHDWFKKRSHLDYGEHSAMCALCLVKTRTRL